MKMCKKKKEKKMEMTKTYVFVEKVWTPSQRFPSTLSSVSPSHLLLFLLPFSILLSSIHLRRIFLEKIFQLLFILFFFLGRSVWSRDKINEKMDTLPRWILNSVKQTPRNCRSRFAFFFGDFFQVFFLFFLPYFHAGEKGSLASKISAFRYSTSDENPRIVHRLDKDTSGILFLARSRLIAEKMTEVFF